MDQSEIPQSDTYSFLRMYGVYFKILGWLGIVGGAVVLTTGFRLNGQQYSGLEPGVIGITTGILMLGLAALLSAVESIGESTRSTQAALRDFIARALENRPGPN